MSETHFVNGRFLTLDSGRPEPRRLVARAGRIARLDGNREPPPAGARVVDLEGRTAIPGPVDAHCHLVSYGMIRLREADLRGARSLQEIRARLREHAALLGLRPGDGRWLLGRGFDQELLPDRAWPTRDNLDQVATDRPVRITRVCGHAVVANSAALSAAGFDPAVSPEPAGFPPGVLTEDRIGAVFAAIPEPTAAEWRQAAEWSCREAARAGFVGVHSLMAHSREVRALVDHRGAGPLPVRVVMQLPYALLAHAAALGLRTGFGDEYLEIGAVKLFSDGSLGARTAALSEPYADDPGTSGELIYPPEELGRRVKEVYRHGFQVCVHAIGDRAMIVTLDALLEAATVFPPAFPPRIEHASLVSTEIVERMRREGVGAAVQPQFARSDSWTPERLGPDRQRWCYAFRSLWEAGIPLAGSTDCPVETLDAMAALGQAVHRPAWSPDEALPLDAALRIFSEGSYALRGFPRFQSGAGRLAEGQFADFVVLDADPRAVSPAEVERIGVAMTVVGGEISYNAA